MGKDRDSIEQILQICLELLFSGKETVDSLLARYPEHAEELRLDLEAAEMLHTWKKDLAPRPGFVSASRHRIIARIQEEQPTGLSLLQMLTDKLFWQYWLNKNFVRLALVGVFVLAIIINASRVALISQQALPGDRLYPVKRALEKAELAVSLDQTQDAALHLKFTERRLDELFTLAQANRYEALGESVEALESQVNQTIQSLDSAADQNVELTRAMAESLASILIKEQEELYKLADQAPVTAQPVLEEAAEISISAAEVTRGWLRTLPPTRTEAPPAAPTRTPATRSTQQVRFPTSAPTRTPLPTRTPRPTPTSAPIQQEPVFPVPTRPVYTSPTPLPVVPVTPLPSNTPQPTSTPEPTNTPVPTETNTPRPTSTNTPEPTDTPVPSATNTPRPTSTDTPEPTDTPVPTETNTPRPTSTGTPETSGTADPSMTPPGMNGTNSTTTGTPTPFIIEEGSSPVP